MTTDFCSLGNQPSTRKNQPEKKSQLMNVNDTRRELFSKGKSKFGKYSASSTCTGRTYKKMLLEVVGLNPEQILVNLFAN